MPAPVVRYVAGTLRKIGLAASVGGGRGALLRVERIAPLVAHPAAYLHRFQAAGDVALSNELIAAATASSADEAADAWAAADERVVAEAYATPLGYERAPVLLSERMDAENCAVVHPAVRPRSCRFMSAVNAADEERVARTSNHYIDRARRTFRASRKRTRRKYMRRLWWAIAAALIGGGSDGRIRMWRR